jgi:hypothetical protein
MKKIQILSINVNMPSYKTLQSPKTVQELKNMIHEHNLTKGISQLLYFVCHAKTVTN